ncbi:unnamed protein product [Sphagnum tenellum]
MILTLEEIFTRQQAGAKFFYGPDGTLGPVRKTDADMRPFEVFEVELLLSNGEVIGVLSGPATTRLLLVEDNYSPLT